MDAHEYAKEMQQVALDNASANQYQRLVKTVNTQVLEAVEKRLGFEDEPSHFFRLLGTAGESNG